MPPTPTNNAQAANQGSTGNSAAGTNTYGAPPSFATPSPFVAPTDSLDASTLSGGAAPFTLPPAPAPAGTGSAAILKSIPTIASITGQADTPTPAETTNTALNTKLETLSDEDAGKTQAQTAAESAQNLPGLNAQLTDLNSQIIQLKNASSAAQVTADGRLAPSFAITGEQANIDHQYTIKALGLSSLASALQGNIATAQSQADAAVKAQFDPIEAQIKYVQDAIAANKDQMTKEEQTQAETVQAQLADRTTQIANARQDMSTVQAWAAAAVKNNPGNQAAQLAAQNALSIDFTQPDALQKGLTLLGQYQSDPTATAQAAANLALTRSETNKNNLSVSEDAGQLAPYLKATSTGAKYVDLSHVSAASRDKLAQAAAANGVQVITNTNEAADLTNITNAYADLNTMQTTLSGLTSPSVLSRLANNFGVNPVATALQSDPQKAAASTLQDAGLDLFKAISGVQGFRGNSAILQQIKDNLPTIYDTSATAQQKISIVQQLIQNRENAIVGGGTNSSTAAPTGTTLMTGPDGQQYNVPNAQVKAFIAAGGHQ